MDSNADQKSLEELGKVNEKPVKHTTGKAKERQQKTLLFNDFSNANYQLLCLAIPFFFDLTAQVNDSCKISNHKRKGALI